MDTASQIATIVFAFVFVAVYVRGWRWLATNEISAKRVGGLTFVKVGRLSFSYSIRRAA